MDQPNFFYTSLKMLGILIVLTGGLYACLQLVKRLLNAAGSAGKKDQLLRVLNVRPIGIKKQIALVEIPGAVLVIGITGDRIQLLDKIVDAEILNRISTGHISEDRSQQPVSDKG
ncbi:MAG: flagellar biosynthetic protein FliO [Deltaproteobacteria bacterium]|jgi:flagellar protein FliO/FliZ